MTYTNFTLGELLSSDNETIKRNAVSILKTLQKGSSEDKKIYKEHIKNRIGNHKDCVICDGNFSTELDIC